MSYIPTDEVAEGELVLAALFNQIKANIDAAYALLGTTAINLATPLNPEHSTHAAYTENSGLGFLHQYRWLAYGSSGQIVDPSGIEEPVSLTDPDTGIGYMDLESIDWLAYGMYYDVEGVTWAQEFNLRM